MDARGLEGTFGVVTKFINETTRKLREPSPLPILERPAGVAPAVRLGSNQSTAKRSWS